VSYNPLVSVIMPFYNQQEYLLDAVNSVLAQDYTNLELVVVDDASSNCDARQLLSHIPSRTLKVFRNQTNLGSAVSRNRAILESSGELLLPLDSDDLLESSYLRETVPLIADTNVGGVFTDIRLFGDRDLVFSPDTTLISLMAGSTCPPNTFLFKRLLRDELGGYKEDMRFGEDREFWIRALSSGWQFKHLPKALYRYRKHAGGKSNLYRSARFLNQFRQNRSLYLEHLDEVLACREDTVWQHADDYEHLHKEFHLLLDNYRKLEEECKKLSIESRLSIRRQIARKVKDLCKSNFKKVFQVRR